MKESIALPTKYSVVLITIFLVFIIFGIIYFTHNYFVYQSELNKIKSKSINGIIVSSRKSGRGMQFFSVRESQTGVIVEYYLHSSYFFEMNNIRVNDSIRKPADSKVMSFYKLTNGVYENCCSYEIEM